MYSSKSLKIILIKNVKQEKRHFEPPPPPPPPVFSGVRVTRSLVLHVCVVNRFVLFLLAIVLSVLLRFKDSDHPFGIFILFLLSYFCK